MCWFMSPAAFSHVHQLFATENNVYLRMACLRSSSFILGTLGESLKDLFYIYKSRLLQIQEFYTLNKPHFYSPLTLHPILKVTLLRQSLWKTSEVTVSPLARASPSVFLPVIPLLPAPCDPRKRAESPMFSLAPPEGTRKK